MTSLVLKGAVRCGRCWIGVLVSALRVFGKVIEGYGEVSVSGTWAGLCLGKLFLYQQGSGVRINTRVSEGGGLSQEKDKTGGPGVLWVGGLGQEGWGWPAFAA